MNVSDFVSIVPPVVGTDVYQGVTSRGMGGGLVQGAEIN